MDMFDALVASKMGAFGGSGGGGGDAAEPTLTFTLSSTNYDIGSYYKPPMSAKKAYGYSCLRGSRGLSSLNAMFSGCTNLESIDDMSWLEGIRPVNLSQMFYNCKKLNSVDLSYFDTVNVTTMSSMFYECNNLQSVNVSGFITSKVTTFDSMFRNCYLLDVIDVSGFDTSTTTTLSGLFYGCRSLKSVDLSNFQTPKVTNMSYMFEDCQSIKSIDMMRIDMSKVSQMSYMFDMCQSLRCLSIPGFSMENTTSKPTSFFGKTASLSLLSIGSQDDLSVRELKYDIIDSCPNKSNLQIYVPDALVDAYKAASNWSKYAANIHPQSELPDNWLEVE